MILNYVAEHSLGLPKSVLRIPGAMWQVRPGHLLERGRVAARHEDLVDRYRVQEIHERLHLEIRPQLAALDPPLDEQRCIPRTG